MKIKIILLLSILHVYNMDTSFGQVKINGGGLSVGTNTSLSASGLYINFTTKGATGVYSRILTKGDAPNYDCIGVHGKVENTVTTYPAKYIGVFGESSATGGTYSIGVFGKNSLNSGFPGIGVAGVSSTNGGSIGVYGTCYGSLSVPSSALSALYAGYFAGPVTVSGTLTASAVISSSDERLKSNMLALTEEKTIDKLMLLKPVKYTFKQIESESDSVNVKGEKIKFKVKRYYEKSQEFQKKHYGLLAQDLQKVYPDLVYEGGDGYLAINYIEFIPILLQAIQEQQVTIEELQKQQPIFGIADTKTKNVSNSNLHTDEQALLQQNTPNPFSERTEIGYYLPDNIQKASLYVYDMNGRQVKRFDLQQKGQASVVIAGSQLQAGMYLYTLIADGKEIDTKRMILTK